jgi:NifB/MoaA-like Fe-S oxidoreductase
MTLEILIPGRNPTDVFGKTVESLAAQTDKNFSVFISDNFPTQGREHIERALNTLQAAGTVARGVSRQMRLNYWSPFKTRIKKMLVQS